ncbi:hypothetical protein BBC27_05815 [Acidithiobacillus ferrivorans]|uniref:Uncharacterized protein n=1 Tax=Acidithiobacillus ferrivorans TaxID=160808 RepID=A0A1B9C1S0_9PROT|nr:hypothetical protein [Acidithiobacillus ferrivorans]OCB03891.1 hypothetical protein BBC27_05815 [Acidithiobacillus ferrivorans]
MKIRTWLFRILAIAMALVIAAAPALAMTVKGDRAAWGEMVAAYKKLNQPNALRTRKHGNSQDRQPDRGQDGYSGNVEQVAMRAHGCRAIPSAGSYEPAGDGKYLPRSRHTDRRNAGPHVHLHRHSHRGGACPAASGEDDAVHQRPDRLSHAKRDRGRRKIHDDDGLL